MSKCPFNDPNYHCDINEPCPVCGMFGTEDAEDKCLNNEIKRTQLNKQFSKVEDLENLKLMLD